ncbi:ABC transporter permease [Pseudolysinimonas sp.]|jgi:putative ABC transport system permease protein|uniref:ABC transporter permease n=1 Tax=Pseudolysinimonas sp. TaxID=2680009 RepID=UPI00378349F4
MKTLDLVRTAASNTFRAKLRTTLTTLALFVGAFTLTLTTAVGAGVSDYVTKQVASLGADDVLLVSKTTAATTGDGPTPYDPDTSTASSGTPNQLTGGTGALTPADVETLEGIDGVLSVETIQSVALDWVRAGTSDRYELSIAPTSSIAQSDLAAGEQLDPESSQRQLVLPDDYVDALGFDDAAEAIGTVVTIGLTDVLGEAQTVEATVVGVANASLLTSGAGANAALTSELATVQAAGVDTPERYQVAIARFDDTATAAEVTALKERVADAGMSGQTIADQLGLIQTVITGITGVLNAFAIIALLAAAFGIVNTLLMSVQERTREIGLMKAMGMSGRRIFALFSLEAAFIGLLGSVLGVVVAVGVGVPLSAGLAAGPLAGLGGLSILLFEPASLAGVIALIIVIAFLAGTLPARRAARKAPIDALRYE